MKKNKYIKPIQQFFFILTPSLICILALHLITLNYVSSPIFENKIILSYLINYFFALAIFILLITLKEKYAETLGFIFFGGSTLKVIIFLIFLYPTYKLDGDITKLEFTSFFIPYAFCLIIEVMSLLKILNK